MNSKKASGRKQPIAAAVERFNRAAVGRELRMIELKKEINELCARLGQPARYQGDAENEAKPSPA